MLKTNKGRNQQQEMTGSERFQDSCSERATAEFSIPPGDVTSNLIGSVLLFLKYFIASQAIVLNSHTHTTKQKPACTHKGTYLCMCLRVRLRVCSCVNGDRRASVFNIGGV